MPQTLVIFDFGASEEAALQALRRLEGWRQAFRLGDRMKLKFERQPAQPESASSDDDSAGAKKGKSKGKPRAKPESKEAASEKTKEASPDRLRLMVRLEFSSHEKLSYQRWVDRLSAEPLLQGVEKQVLERGQEGFDSAAETFDSLP